MIKLLAYTIILGTVLLIIESIGGVLLSNAISNNANVNNKAINRVKDTEGRSMRVLQEKADLNVSKILWLYSSR